MLCRIFQRAQCALTAAKLCVPNSVLQNELINLQILSSNLLRPTPAVLQSRSFNIAHINRPAPNDRKFNYKHIIHYPEDGKYTIEHLDITPCHGRHPFTGRKIVGTLSHGRDTKYRWIDFNRRGPTDPKSVLEESIIEVLYDPNRSPFIALVGSGSHLRYIIATTTMEIGGIVRSSSFIPEIPIRGTPGDSFSIGALAVGTSVCHMEVIPGQGATFLTAAGVQGRVQQRLPDGKVVVLLPNKHEVALDPNCNVVCGQISNPIHDKIHIGSAMRLRWLGRYPRSGLWQRKDGYCGRKIRRPPPVKHFSTEKHIKHTIQLTSPTEEPKRRVIPSADRVT